MPDGDLESVFEQCFAGENLFAGFGLGTVGEVPVGESVGADLVSGGEPLAEFGGIHKLFGSFAVLYVPVVSPAYEPGYDELDGLHAVVGEGFEAVAKDVAAAVVECEDCGAGLLRFGEGGAVEAVLFYLCELAVEVCGANVEKWIAGTRRWRAKAVPALDRHAAPGGTPLGGPHENLR